MFQTNRSSELFDYPSESQTPRSGAMFQTEMRLSSRLCRSSSLKPLEAGQCFRPSLRPSPLFFLQVSNPSKRGNVSDRHLTDWSGYPGHVSNPSKRGNVSDVLRFTGKPCRQSRLKPLEAGQCFRQSRKGDNMKEKESLKPLEAGQCFRPKS